MGSTRLRPGLARLLPDRLRRLARAQVDPEGQDPVLERSLRIADDGEVLVVELGLLHEAAPLRPLDRWDATAADGAGPFPEALDHRADIELFGHGPRLGGGPEALEWRCPESPRHGSGL